MKSRGRHLCPESYGFTIVEVVISVAIMATVTGTMFALMNQAVGIFHAQPDTADMQQRLRVGIDALYQDLVMAGGGTVSTAGTLGHGVAALLPFRRGAKSPDPPGSYRPDCISILYVPAGSPQTKTTLPVAGMEDMGREIRVEAQAGCPVSEPLCGFKPGTMAIIFDDSGAYDTFRISALVNSPPAVQHVSQPLSNAYSIGAHIAPVVATTYWLKADTAAHAFQLMQYDGYQTDLPLFDNVVGLQFEYYGDPQPPALLKPVTEPNGPWTSYGPKPPALAVDNPNDYWAAGENCLFRVGGSQQSVRPEMALLGGATDVLVRLDPSQLTDGPWCPDAASSQRVDADLFRVRRIRVRLRVQVGPESLRGTGTLFARPGTSHGGGGYVPDQEIAFDVTPRNLNIGR